MAGSSSCPSDNSADVDQASFWSSNGINWDAHRIGWVISGSCAAAVRIPPLTHGRTLTVAAKTVLISLVTVLQHAR